jgi:hypothetical protein
MSGSLGFGLIGFFLILTVLLSFVFVFISLNFTYLFLGGSVCLSLMLVTEFTGNKIILDIKQGGYSPKTHIINPLEVVDNEFLRISKWRGCISTFSLLKNVRKESEMLDYWSLNEEFEYYLENNNGKGLILYGDIVCKGDNIKRVFDYFRYNLWLKEENKSGFNQEPNKEYLLYGGKGKKGACVFAAMSAWQGFLWQWSISNLDTLIFRRRNFIINLTESDFLCYKYLKTY